MLLGQDADDLAFGLDRLVAKELSWPQRFLQRIKRAGRWEKLLALAAAGLFAVLFHLTLKAIPIESEVMLGGQSFEQFGWKTVRRIKLGGLLARDHCAAAVAHAIEQS